MALEIERKYLVHPERLPLAMMQKGIHILQGYLAEEPSIRFRIQNEKVIITIKRTNPDGSRFEFEAENAAVTPTEQKELIALARFPVIEKIRYRIPYADRTWEIDVYQGSNLGLITADIELPRLDYPIVFPDWINSASEITRDARYFNWNLGCFPFREWEKS